MPETVASVGTEDDAASTCMRLPEGYGFGADIFEQITVQHSNRRLIQYDVTVDFTAMLQDLSCSC